MNVNASALGFSSVPYPKFQGIYIVSGEKQDFDTAFDLVKESQEHRQGMRISRRDEPSGRWVITTAKDDQISTQCGYVAATGKLHPNFPVPKGMKNIPVDESPQTRFNDNFLTHQIDFYGKCQQILERNIETSANVRFKWLQTPVLKMLNTFSLIEMTGLKKEYAQNLLTVFDEPEYVAQAMLALPVPTSVHQLDQVLEPMQNGRFNLETGVLA